MVQLSSFVTLLAICSSASAAALQPRACPPAPTGSVVYRIDNMVVTNKNGKASDISFDIAKSVTGKKALTCTPDTGIITGFKGGKRFECDGLGNGNYKFAYFGSGQNALWLRNNPALSSKVQGTAPLSLSCSGNTCSSTCPIYVAMLAEEPDD